MSNLTYCKEVDSLYNKKSLLTSNFRTIECPKDANSKGIIPNNTSDITVLKWDMNLGKTFQQECFISQTPHLRHVYIVPTQALAVEASKRLNLPCYLDFGGVNDPRWHESLVVCFPSYHKVKGYIDCLYVDEIESCLQQFNSDLFTASQARDNYTDLVSDINQAKRVTLMDAHAGDATCMLLQNTQRVDEVEILTCKGNPETWVDMGSQQKHILLIHQRIRHEKRLAIACSSQSKAQTLYDTLRKDFPTLDIRCYHADNFHEEQAKYTDPFICDVLIYTSVIGSGVSIDKVNHYDERHIVISENTGNARNMQQMTGRVRNPIDPRIYFSGDNRTPLETWKFTPERLIQNWRLALDDTKKLVHLNINHSRRFDNYPERVEMLHLLATIESASVQNGNKWAATWIRQNCTVEDNDEDVESEDEIREKFQKAREERKEKRALSILETPDVSPEEAKEIERKFSKTEKERHILEKHRLQNFFGPAFNNASEEEQLRIIKEDESKKLTHSTINYAELLLSQNSIGCRMLALMDAEQIETASINKLKHRTQRTQITNDILFKAKIDLNQSTNIIDREHLEDAYWYAVKQHRDLERLNFPKLRPDSHIKWLSTLLAKFGINTKSLGRFTQRELVEKSDGTVEGLKSRQRAYEVDAESIQRMNLLSSHLLNLWTGRYSSELDSMNIENSTKEMSRTEYNYLLQKVVDTQLNLLYNTDCIDNTQTPRPIRPSQVPLSKALKPHPVAINLKRWQEVSQKRRSNGKKQTEIESWVESQAKQGKSILYTKTTSTMRCPRLYPIIEDSNRSNESGLLMLSSLSKDLRRTFIVNHDQELLDYDMKTANLSILAAASKDEFMREWVKGDAHQSTGDMMLRGRGRGFSDKERRKFGKIVNNSMIAGGTEYLLRSQLHEQGVKVSIQEAKELHDAWWNRFPKAKTFRENHRLMIADKVAKGESHSLSWYGENMFYFDAALLSGERRIKDWPDTVRERRLKAERSAFTALLRAYESNIMKHVFIEANRLGLGLVCPMFDGALFAVPSQKEAVS